MPKRLAPAAPAQKENGNQRLTTQLHQNPALRNIIQRCLVEGFNRALWQCGANRGFLNPHFKTFRNLHFNELVFHFGDLANDTACCDDFIALAQPAD